MIHCAFIHNFADYAVSAQIDKQAIEVLGEALIGTDKPFLVTSGVPGSQASHFVTENDSTENGARMSETAALPFAERGVDVRIVRPSRFVYDENLANAFIAALIGIAQGKDLSVYVGDGANRIHAVHLLDLAELYRLALEKGDTGAIYQGVSNFAIPFGGVAAAIGKRLGVPTASITPQQATEHFGFLGHIVATDNPASSELTQQALGWQPSHPTLLEVLASA